MIIFSSSTSLFAFLFSTLLYSCWSLNCSSRNTLFSSCCVFMDDWASFLEFSEFSISCLTLAISSVIDWICSDLNSISSFQASLVSFNSSILLFFWSIFKVISCFRATIVLILSMALSISLSTELSSIRFILMSFTFYKSNNNYKRYM